MFFFGVLFFCSAVLICCSVVRLFWGHPWSRLSNATLAIGNAYVMRRLIPPKRVDPRGGRKREKRPAPAIEPNAQNSFRQLGRENQASTGHPDRRLAR